MELISLWKNGKNTEFTLLTLVFVPLIMTMVSVPNTPIILCGRWSIDFALSVSMK
jgi:hypothetical protein